MPCETKEKILWARFEFTDLNDPIFYTDAVESVTIGPPILLVLGCTFGVQVRIFDSHLAFSKVFVKSHTSFFSHNQTIWLCISLTFA